MAWLTVDLLGATRHRLGGPLVRVVLLLDYHAKPLGGGEERRGRCEEEGQRKGGQERGQGKERGDCRLGSHPVC